MHNNFYFLRQLSQQLKETLGGYSIVSCFTQNKEELVIEFNNTRHSIILKASLQSGFCCLSFPERFNRARKNSMDLFPEMILKKITDVRQYENERCFSIELESDLTLLFKMHGNRSNIILFHGEHPIHLFRNHLHADNELNLGQLDRLIDWSYEYFTAHQEKLKESYFTFGKEVWAYLNERGFDKAEVEQRWTLFLSTKQLLEDPVFYILRKKEKLVFCLLPSAEIVEQFTDPVKAITYFYSAHQVSNSFDTEKSSVIRQLHAQLTAGKNFLLKNRQKLEELHRDTHYQQWADLIMANLGNITSGLEKITLENFYDQQQPVEIKLRPDLNAQMNAEVFYRKAKNRQLEITQLTNSIATKEKQLQQLEQQLTDVEREKEVTGLQEIMAEFSTIKKEKEVKKTLPYHEFEFKGYKIWVGKDAKSNDILTLKYSFKDDLWLHAKDVAGSHVLIKHQAGKNFPKEVIERAAELAAYNSKRKNESLCPVTVTPKKYVRKRKGDPAGMVVVEREDVVLVTPTLK